MRFPTVYETISKPSAMSVHTNNKHGQPTTKLCLHTLFKKNHKPINNDFSYTTETEDLAFGTITCVVRPVSLAQCLSTNGLR